MSTATIVLAAGSSSRLGNTPKQLLTHGGKTLLRRIADTVLSLNAGPVIVVLGATWNRLQPELADLPLRTVVNEKWAEGMASSLRMGLQALTDQPFDAFLVVLTDQPYVNAELLRQIIDAQQQTGKGIVACRYGEPGNLGVPALFARRYQADFMALTGDTGARKLIRQHSEDCAAVSFPQANVDLDTWADVNRWQQSQPNDPA